jgi:DNA-cytosine methyltransferase
MKVLSLFDGMSCLQIALKELGTIPETYYASEIDKHAIAQTQLNFPDTIQLGSVTEWKTWDIDWSNIGLIGAGSPCQGFSFAGKQLAFDDPRSKLFFVFIDILNHARKFNKNVKFLLENVDMKREHMNVINNYCGLFAVNINSNRVSAQNRNRWYWSNIRTKQVGLFGETHTDIPQPKDRGILLKDILENEVPEKYYLSDKMLNVIEQHGAIKTIDNKKSNCLLTTYHKMGGRDQQYVNTEICVAMRGREACLTPKRTEYGKSIRKAYEAGEITEQRKNIQQLEPREDGKTNTLTSVQKDNLVMEVQSRIRRLTPTEYARLQTIPEWYKWGCSDTQQYRMLGNGWTVDVIAHILSFLK